MKTIIYSQKNTRYLTMCYNVGTCMVQSLYCDILLGNVKVYSLGGSTPQPVFLNPVLLSSCSAVQQERLLLFSALVINTIYIQNVTLDKYLYINLTYKSNNITPWWNYSYCQKRTLAGETFFLKLIIQHSNQCYYSPNRCKGQPTLYSLTHFQITDFGHIFGITDY